MESRFSADLRRASRRSPDAISVGCDPGRVARKESPRYTRVVDLGAWYSAITDQIVSNLCLASSPTDAPPPRADHAVHLAVVVEPFLGFMLDGSKRIESRFSTVKVPPFRAVREGNLCFSRTPAAPSLRPRWQVKCGATARSRRECSPICVIVSALISETTFPGFWERRDGARYATFIRLGRVTKLRVPLDCPKTDRRGWVVFASTLASARSLRMNPLVIGISGRIATGKTDFLQALAAEMRAATTGFGGLRSRRLRPRTGRRVARCPPAARRGAQARPRERGIRSACPQPRRPIWARDCGRRPPRRDR